MSAAEDGYVGATEKIAMTSQIEELESAIKKFHTLPRAPRPAHATNEPRFLPEFIRATGELVTESARLDAHRLRELAIVDALKKAMAGTIVASDGGYSTITFSDSVAFLWGVNPAVASLVAHQVGHSITSKCYELYRSSFGENDELWATAWALGMGYTLDGNGESKYGIHPSRDLIELSAQCR